MSVQQINWRLEFDALKPYLEKQGGVVHVRYRGQACAPRAFLSTLKSAIEDDGASCTRTSVRIDPEFFTTHYLVDVLHEFARKLGCSLDIKKATAPLAKELVVASGNQAQGDLEVTTNLHLYGSDPAEAPVLRDDRVARICQALRKYLESGHFIIVLTETTPQDQSPFWHDFWSNGLSMLVKDGLVLVKMINEERGGEGQHPDEPSPDMILNLPTEFDEDRQQDAIEDLARILVSQIKRQKSVELSLDAAIQRVSAFVYSHKGAIDRLHDEWSGVLMALVRDAS